MRRIAIDGDGNDDDDDDDDGHRESDCGQQVKGGRRESSHSARS